MTRLNWALFREQKKLAHPLLHTTPQRHRSARFREGKTLLWGHPAKQHASPGVLWLPAALLSGDGLWLRGQRRDWGCWGAPETAPPPPATASMFPGSPASFPAALELQRGGSCFSTWLQPPSQDPPRLWGVIPLTCL